MDYSTGGWLEGMVTGQQNLLMVLPVSLQIHAASPSRQTAAFADAEHASYSRLRRFTMAPRRIRLGWESNPERRSPGRSGHDSPDNSR